MIPQSFSSMKLFNECPYRYYRLKILKDVKEDFSSSAIEWGNEVHAAIEQTLKTGAALPDKFSRFADYTSMLVGLKGDKYVEHRMAITYEYTPTDFFDQSAKYRGIADYIVVRDTTALLFDHKTGARIAPTNQLALNSILIFATMPQVEIVKAAFVWLQHNEVTKYEYRREDMFELEQKLFEPTVCAIAQAHHLGEWPKRQSVFCNWCPVHDCEHHP